MNKVMNKHEVAELLQVSERQIDYLRQAGALACVKIGRSVRFCSEDVESFLMSNRLIVSTEGLSTTKGGNTHG